MLTKGYSYRIQEAQGERMFIKQEQASDITAVDQVIKKAFASLPYSDHQEHLLVRRLRQSKEFIPELSLVAELDGQIVGHILFTKAQVNHTTVLALAPLAVHPDYQQQGIGSALVKKGHQLAQALQFPYSIVLGDPQYYSRFGYQAAKNWGILPPFDVPCNHFMGIKLIQSAPPLHGTLAYSEAFGV